MVDMTEIVGAPGLDPIHVYWHDFEPSKGSVTITCYGSAWTAYFGAMGGDTIRQFFARADVGYLVTKLGITPLLKQRKTDHAYLGRIVSAIKDAIAVQEGQQR